MQETPQVRIDKWLWAARLFKTRSLAAEAVSGGKVHINDARVKASREVHPGDRLSITRGTECLDVVVVALSDRRGPAPVARGLYEETAESQARRREQAALRRMRAQANPAPAKRPDKKSRRQIIKFTQGGY